MKDRIRSWLGRLAEGGATHDTEPDALQLAAATLMVEAARLDGDFDASEQRLIRRVLAEHFGLSADEVETLIKAADARQQDAVEISRMTMAIKDGYPPEKRTEIIEMLWEVVLADGELHPYEANLLRRIGGLIYVSDRENGEARQRVIARRNG